MLNDPGWSFFFLEEKLVPEEFENVVVLLICTRLDWEMDGFATIS
jgi:hypothetical protein